RHPGELPRVLRRCSFLVDGDPVGPRAHDTVRLADSGTVEVLLPFAGRGSMTDQPYAGHDPYLPHGQPPRPYPPAHPPPPHPPHPRQPEAHAQSQQYPQPQAWPGQQAYAADPYADQQHTQQWQGQTWETSVQPPVPAAAVDETAYLPPQGHPEPVSGPTVHPGYGEAVTYGTPPPGPLPAAAPVPPASAHRAAATAAPGPAQAAPGAP